jgi:hypothetical protein
MKDKKRYEELPANELGGPDEDARVYAAAAKRLGIEQKKPNPMKPKSEPGKKAA